MTEAELIAAGYLNDPGYQNFRNWISAGAKHGTLGGKIYNPAVARVVDLPWGENKAYDAAGNEVGMYIDAPAGVTSPYGPAGGAPSAPSPGASLSLLRSFDPVYAGGTPNFDERTGQYVTPGALFSRRLGPVTDLPPAPGPMPAAAPKSVDTFRDELAKRLAQWKQGTGTRAHIPV